MTVLTTDWHLDAACTGLNPDTFFPETGQHDVAKAAKRVCNGCPVRDQCLEAALREESGDAASYRFGIRGGMTARERRALSPSRPVEASRGVMPFGSGRRTRCDWGHTITTNTAGRRRCEECRLATSRMQSRAAHLLGLTRQEFTKRHGYSRAAVELVLAEIDEEWAA